MQSKGWNVLNQEGYLDIETGKWRTIDIVATKAKDLPDSSIYKRLHMSLIIECKKISDDKPWVFFVREKKHNKIFDPLAAIGLVKYVSKPQLHPSCLPNIVDGLHYYSPNFNKVAVIPYEPFLKEGKSNLYEAQHQVIKSLLYEKDELERFLSMEETIEETIPKVNKINLISIAYPVIIVDGKLYELELENEKLKLAPSNYTQYLTSYGFPYSEEFLVDVIKIDFLNEYLDMIEREIEALTKKIASIDSRCIIYHYREA